jgi:molecular chaperone GrpE
MQADPGSDPTVGATGDHVAEERAMNNSSGHQRREAANRGYSDTQALRPEPITITDRRRIDPDTGHVRTDAPPPPARKRKSNVDNPAPRQPADTTRRKASKSAVDFASSDADRVAELTNDLHQLQAEYANYRRRVERDRTMIADNDKATAAAHFLDILDDLDRAREHGDTAHEPLHRIAHKIRTVLTHMDVTAFGEHGDRYEPPCTKQAPHPAREPTSSLTPYYAPATPSESTKCSAPHWSPSSTATTTSTKPTQLPQHREQANTICRHGTRTLHPTGRDISA